MSKPSVTYDVFDNDVDAHDAVVKQQVMIAFYPLGSVCIYHVHENNHRLIDPLPDLKTTSWLLDSTLTGYCKCKLSDVLSALEEHYTMDLAEGLPEEPVSDVSIEENHQNYVRDTILDGFALVLAGICAYISAPLVERMLNYVLPLIAIRVSLVIGILVVGAGLLAFSYSLSLRAQIWIGVAMAIQLLLWPHVLRLYGFTTMSLSQIYVRMGIGLISSIGASVLVYLLVSHIAARISK